MRPTLSIVGWIAGVAQFALSLYALVAAPGLLSDRDSTVPLHMSTETRR